jgi:hypothetical protein
LRKWGQRSEKEKSGGDEMATVDHDDGDDPVSSESTMVMAVATSFSPRAWVKE